MLGPIVATLAAASKAEDRAPVPDLVFAPRAGTVLRKTFRREMRLEWGGGTLTSTGSLLDRAGWVRRVGAHWREEQHVVLRDRYGATREGRPMTLLRTHERLGSTQDQGWTLGEWHGCEIAWETTRSGAGALEGADVRFAWDADADAYDPTYATPTSLSSDLLVGLEEGTDLRGLLPPEPRPVGGVWFVDADVVRRLLWPGGTIPYRDADGHVFLESLDWHLTKDLKGTLRVELLGVAHVSGERWAQLALRGRLELEARFRHDVRVAVGDDGLDFPVEERLDVAAEVHGSADWNLDARHLQRLELEARLDVDQVADVPPDPYRFLASDSMTLVGKWSGIASMTATFERSDGR